MDNAILQFTNAIKPGSSGGGQAVHYNNRGLAYFHEGLKDKALDDFNDAVRLNTQGDPTIYFNRGNVLLALENFQEAISDYKEASKISPSNPKYHHAQGIAYEALAEKVVKDHGDKHRRFNFEELPVEDRCSDDMVSYLRPEYLQHCQSAIQMYQKAVDVDENFN